jgi:DNA-binding NtrC family response regulator
MHKLASLIKHPLRELRNMVEYAAMVCPGDLVLPEHLPPQVRFAQAPAEQLPTSSAPARKPARKKG